MLGVEEDEVLDAEVLDVDDEALTSRTRSSMSGTSWTKSMTEDVVLDFEALDFEDDVLDIEDEVFDIEDLVLYNIEDVVLDAEDLVLDFEDRGRRPRHRGLGPLHRGIGTDEVLSVEVLDVDDEFLDVGYLVDKVLQPDEVHRIRP